METRDYFTMHSTLGKAYEIKNVIAIINIFENTLGT